MIKHGIHVHEFLFGFTDDENYEEVRAHYASDELEASALFKIALDAMNTYNMKIGNMRRTREIIKDNKGKAEYKEWSEQYPDRKPMAMKVIQVSIVILFSFFFFKLKMHRTLSIIF